MKRTKMIIIACVILDDDDDDDFSDFGSSDNADDDDEEQMMVMTMMNSLGELMWGRTGINALLYHLRVTLCLVIGISVVKWTVGIISQFEHVQTRFRFAQRDDHIELVVNLLDILGWLLKINNSWKAYAAIIY